ncbi:MAG TPA: hypothetical protein VJL89_02320, partial [Thermodesulfovibrionia bacterium]|nr:hypothetical protein [Thermodesulfovibrionia bacterium]
AFEHMIHGFKCKVDDVNAMADAIKTLLTNMNLDSNLAITADLMYLKRILSKRLLNGNWLFMINC